MCGPVATWCIFFIVQVLGYKADRQKRIKWKKIDQKS